MQWVLAGLVGIVAVLVVLWLRTSGALYKRLFSGEHLVAFAAAVGQVRQAAMGNIEDASGPDAPPGADDPRPILRECMDMRDRARFQRVKVPARTE